LRDSTGVGLGEQRERLDDAVHRQGFGAVRQTAAGKQRATPRRHSICGYPPTR
jgi:hypothetical protein